MIKLNNGAQTAMWTIIFGLLFSTTVAVVIVPLYYFFVLMSCNGILQNFAGPSNEQTAFLWKIYIIWGILSLVLGFMLARKLVYSKQKKMSAPQETKPQSPSPGKPEENVNILPEEKGKK